MDAVLLQQGSPAVEDKKETRAGGRRWSMVLWTWRLIKADLSSIPSGPGTRPRMCGWTRQGRMIKWCQGGKGAGEASPFQRSWRPARHGSYHLRRDPGRCTWMCRVQMKEAVSRVPGMLETASYWLLPFVL
jgi:hypothetical protein